MSDGGPAFPALDARTMLSGMSLRDYFAAQALQGVLAADTEDLLSVGAITSVSYRIADAMLKEREK